MPQEQSPPAASLTGLCWHTAPGHSPWDLALLKVWLQLPSPGAACLREIFH